MNRTQLIEELFEECDPGKKILDATLQALLPYQRGRRVRKEAGHRLGHCYLCGGNFYLDELHSCRFPKPK